MERMHGQNLRLHSSYGIVDCESNDIASRTNTRLSIKSRAATSLASGLVTLILCCSLAIFCRAQSTAAPAVSSQAPKSLGEQLRHPEGKEIHIFYIHGIGSDGPTDRDSGWDTIRRYGFSTFQPAGNFLRASSSETEPLMITSSPSFQFAGVET